MVLYHRGDDYLRADCSGSGRSCISKEKQGLDFAVRLPILPTKQISAYCTVAKTTKHEGSVTVKRIAYILPLQGKTSFLAQLARVIPTEYWCVTETKSTCLRLQATQGLSAWIQCTAHEIVVQVQGQNTQEVLLWENIFAELCERLQAGACCDGCP